MPTYDKIQDIVTETYGDGDMVYACIAYLTRRINEDSWDSHGRKHAITCILWNWFPGGTTAEGTAQRIEDALA